VRQAVPGAVIDGILVQQMLKAGREMIAGIVRDPAFGPLVMFGLGGVLVEVLRDVIFRVAPIHLRDAHDMVRGIRGSRILEEIRGMPAADKDAIAGVLLRLSRLAGDFPEIEEIDINPLLASHSGAVAADGRVLLRSREAAP
jgi:acyl-CoA synthetase (NDP forming)